MSILTVQILRAKDAELLALGNTANGRIVLIIRLHPDPTAFSHFRFLSSRWGLPLGNEGVQWVHLCFHTSPHPLHLFTDPLLVDLMSGKVLCTA